MNASIDTDVVIHLYLSDKQALFFEIFYGLYMHEYLCERELKRKSFQVYNKFSSDVAEQYKGCISFLMRNLKKVQIDESFNSEARLEIPKLVLEELLVNALIHRDYFIDSPIKIFIFDNRVEIISPGKLPNTLTIEKIKYGLSLSRNPVLTSFASKILPYRGVGTGVLRALKAYPDIELVNNIELNQFESIIYRKNY